MNINRARCETCKAPVLEDGETGAQVHVGGFKDCGVEGEVSRLADLLLASTPDN